MFGRIKSISTPAESQHAVHHCPLYYHEKIPEVWLQTIVDKKNYIKSFWAFFFKMAAKMLCSFKCPLQWFYCIFQNYTYLKIHNMWLKTDFMGEVHNFSFLSIVDPYTHTHTSLTKNFCCMSLHTLTKWLLSVQSQWCQVRQCCLYLPERHCQAAGGQLPHAHP